MRLHIFLYGSKEYYRDKTYFTKLLFTQWVFNIIEPHTNFKFALIIFLLNHNHRQKFMCACVARCWGNNIFGATRQKLKKQFGAIRRRLKCK